MHPSVASTWVAWVGPCRYRSSPGSSSLWLQASTAGCRVTPAPKYGSTGAWEFAGVDSELLCSNPLSGYPPTSSVLARGCCWCSSTCLLSLTIFWCLFVSKIPNNDVKLHKTHCSDINQIIEYERQDPRTVSSFAMYSTNHHHLLFGDNHRNIKGLRGPGYHKVWGKGAMAHSHEITYNSMVFGCRPQITGLFSPNLVTT